ncbi:MAG: hypothetical protein QOH52_2663 [Pseudonocardiales bacterium]|nr:hypothetical protein [Pseudonocardiales bacterium]
MQPREPIDAARVEIADLAGPDAAHVLAQLRTLSPVAWVPDVGGWLVTGHDLTGQVMRDDVTFTVDDPNFSTARLTGPSMLSLDGAPHRRHRTPFVGPFRPRRVAERFEDEITALVIGLLARIRADGQADLRRSLAGPLSVAVVTNALGLEQVDAGMVLDWYGHIVGAVSTMTTGSAVPPEATAAMAALAAHIRAGLRSTQDSVLREATRDLDEADIIANAAVMMFGGIETTEGMISNVLLHLLQNPSALEATRADPALAEVVVEESLRLEPAAAAVDRYATRDVVLAGAQIRARDLVRVSITAANRDPAVFSDPDRYDLYRTNLRAQLSFAQGPHVCVAAELARLEARLAVILTLRELPGLRLERPVRPTGHIFRKPAELPVCWAPLR